MQNLAKNTLKNLFKSQKKNATKYGFLTNQIGKAASGAELLKFQNQLLNFKSFNYQPKQNFSQKSKVDLVAIDYKAENASELFVQSLKDTGFGVLKNHPLSQDLVQNIYKNWEEFFKNGECKEQYLTGDKYDGHFPANLAETAKGHTKKDIKEYFHVYPWGRIPPQLKDEIMDYYVKTNAFASELLGWIEQHTDKEISDKFSQPLSEMIVNSEQTLLRILHYPPMTGDEEPGAIRAGAHEDINLITILPAANEPGLQVLTKENNWIDVPCDFGNLIINAGDMLQECTNFHYKSTSHRVINPSGKATSKSRVSLPLFLHPRPDVVLSERHTAGSYLTERLTELAKNN